MKLLSLFLPALIFAAAVRAEDEQIIEIKTLTAQMRYDTPEFAVPPGAKVRIIFNNVDDLPHNLAFCKTGTDVLAMSLKQMEKPDEAVKRNFMPDDPAIFAHSTLLNPHQQEEIKFTAPEKPGTYPYVCTFPGHAVMMRGEMKVQAPGEGLKDLKFQLYLGAWKNLPDFSKLTPHRAGPVPDGKIQIKLDDYKNDFGLVFTGKITAKKTGDYNFSIASDDGGRILIDGRKVVENDGIHPASTIKTGKVKLNEGEHDFRLEYFQATGQIDLFAGWQGPGFQNTALSTWVPSDWSGKSKSKKKNQEFVSIPMVVKDEAVIYRNFIQGAGNRAIGVGYPGGFNIAWSAEIMGPALIWRGAFMDAGRHWTSRGGGYQPPMGYDVFAPTQGEPLAVLTSPEEAWPEYKSVEVEGTKRAYRAPGYEWKGYHLDAKRAPTFNYEWNGVHVAEHYDTKGSGITKDGKLMRTVKLTGKIPAGAYLRIAAGNKIEAKDDAFLVDGKYLVRAAGAIKSDRQIIIAAKPEMKVTYSWPH